MTKEKLEQWIREIEELVADLTGVVERRFVFQQTKEIVMSNRVIQQDNLFYDYFRINYVYAQIVHLGQILDQDSRNRSFKVLLEDISCHPELFEPKWRDELMNRNTPPETLKTFGRSLEEKTLSENQVLIDICQISQKFSPIKRFRDRRVAHSQKSGAVPNLDFRQVDEFIDYLEGRMLVYKHFLTGRAQPQLMPIIDYDWKAIFRVPWIETPPA